MNRHSRARPPQWQGIQSSRQPLGLVIFRHRPSRMASPGRAPVPPLTGARPRRRLIGDAVTTRAPRRPPRSSWRPGWRSSRACCCSAYGVLEAAHIAVRPGRDGGHHGGSSSSLLGGAAGRLRAGWWLRGRAWAAEPDRGGPGDVPGSRLELPRRRHHLGRGRASPSSRSSSSSGCCTPRASTPSTDAPTRTTAASRQPVSCSDVAQLVEGAGRAAARRASGRPRSRRRSPTGSCSGRTAAAGSASRAPGSASSSGLIDSRISTCSSSSSSSPIVSSIDDAAVVAAVVGGVEARAWSRRCWTRCPR